MRTLILGEDEVRTAISDALDREDEDFLADIAGKMFGGTFTPAQVFKKDGRRWGSGYIFEPNSDYGGAFGDLSE